VFFYESMPIQELTTSLCVCSQSYTLKMEAIRSSETSVLIRATRRHLPEDDNQQRNVDSVNNRDSFMVQIKIIYCFKM
jgi:hypothetical protein